jgi:hypothetical protein
MILNYYDLVLGLIPLSVVGISGVLFGVGVQFPFAVSMGALFGAGLIGHAMFVRAPVGGSKASDGSTACGTPARGSEAGSDQYGTAD